MDLYLSQEFFLNNYFSIEWLCTFIKICGSTFGLSFLFHWCICLPFIFPSPVLHCHDHLVLIPGFVSPPTLLFLLKTILASVGSSSFHIDFIISLVIYTKMLLGCCLGKIGIFPILSLLIYAVLFTIAPKEYEMLMYEFPKMCAKSICWKL